MDVEMRMRRCGCGEFRDAEIRRCGDVEMWRCGCEDAVSEMRIRRCGNAEADVDAEMWMRRCGWGDADAEMQKCGYVDVAMQICGYADTKMLEMYLRISASALLHPHAHPHLYMRTFAPAHLRR